MVKLSAFADEVTGDFLGQMKYLSKEKIGLIELRFLNGKNILELNKKELDETKKICADYGIAVGAIGSPIGKVRIDEYFGGHLEKFKRAVDIALFFQTPFIRMFSYYPPEGKDIGDYRSEVIDRMFAKVEIIEDVDVVMVHENEGGIYGETAERCADMVEAVNSPKLRLVYDPANFVFHDGITDNIQSCWPIMKPYVAHIHIKDWKVGAKLGSIPGEGNAQIKQLLGELFAMGYTGQLTMEPHLKEGGQFGGVTGSELFSESVLAVRKMADEIGLDIQ